MSDFTYDNEDFTAIRVANKDLQKLEREALFFNTGFLSIFIATQYLTRNGTRSYWKKSPLLVVSGSFITSSLLYSAFTWTARSRYDKVAKYINTKYSSIISRTLNYQK